jgi:hypothetical protein
VPEFQTGESVLHQIGLQHAENVFQSFPFCVDVQVDGLGKIQAEDAHDGLGVDYVSSGYQVKIKIKFGNLIDKGLYLVDGIE